MRTVCLCLCSFVGPPHDHVVPPASRRRCMLATPSTSPRRAVSLPYRAGVSSKHAYALCPAVASSQRSEQLFSRPKTNALHCMLPVPVLCRCIVKDPEQVLNELAGPKTGDAAAPTTTPLEWMSGRMAGQELQVCACDI